MFTRFVQVLLTVTALSTASLAAAQQSGQGPMMKQSGGPDVEVSEQQVEKFAELQKEMRGIQKEYMGKMKEQGKSKKLKKKMNQEVMQAIKDVGLSTKEYKQIAMAARQDKDLRNQIKQAMQQ